MVGAWVRRPVYFGTSVAAVCRGMGQSEVTRFFLNGLLCVRAFDPITSEHLHVLLSDMFCKKFVDLLSLLPLPHGLQKEKEA